MLVLLKHYKLLIIAVNVNHGDDSYVIIYMLCDVDEACICSIVYILAAKLVPHKNWRMITVHVGMLVSDQLK